MRRASIAVLLLIAGCGSHGAGVDTASCSGFASAASDYNDALDAQRSGVATASDTAAVMGAVAKKMTTVAGYSTGALQTDAAAIALHAGRARVALMAGHGSTAKAEQDQAHAAFDDAQPMCQG